MQYGKLSDTTKKLKFVVVIVSHTSLEGYSGLVGVYRKVALCFTLYDRLITRIRHDVP